jgi:predicted SnoaL-like aldol condensation-catalyzing enzyme
MRKTTPEQNKALVLEAFDTLFNRRDYGAAERFWSDRYIQHSAHIAPGRDGLFNLIRTLSATLKYENQIIVAEGDFVIAHGRFSALTNGAPRQIVPRCRTVHSAKVLLSLASQSAIGKQRHQSHGAFHNAGPNEHPLGFRRPGHGPLRGCIARCSTTQ